MKKTKENHKHTLRMSLTIVTNETVRSRNLTVEKKNLKMKLQHTCMLKKKNDERNKSQ